MSNNITSAMHITHIGYYPKAKHHFRERIDGSDQNILIYCESGKGWIKYNNEKITIRRNQACILPRKEYHSYGSDLSDPWNIYWMHFNGYNVSQFSSIIGCTINIDDSHCSRIEDRLSLFEEIYRNIEMGYSPENMEYVSYCATYFLASMKYLSQFRKTKNLGEIDVIQESILYMKDNINNNLTLYEIAENVGYSSSHFGSIFQKKTSFTPMAYFNQLKIQRACSLLQFSDLKIKEVAYRLGYYDPFHFSKAFKKEMNLTPKEYREKYNP